MRGSCQKALVALRRETPLVERIGDRVFEVDGNAVV